MNPSRSWHEVATTILEETLELTKEDSGSPRSPISYRAYPGEQPVLSGGRRLTDCQPHKDKILKCPIADASGGRWKFRQLFLDGQRQIRARFPNLDPHDPIFSGWAFAEDPINKNSSKSFRFSSGTFPRRWKQPWQGEVYIVVGKYGSYTLPIS